MSHKNLSVKIKIPKNLNKKLNNKKIIQIYRKFEKSLNIDKNFIVAVSGGPDSLALAFLAKIYSIKKRVNSNFFIVDHKLRTESTKEAKAVKQVLKKHSINAQILTWKGPKPSKNVQSLARKKRYELLFAQCKKCKTNNILLGHHQDDLFENFFIRILRGSGLKGLISLDKKSNIDGKNLLRPLLDQKKEDLVYLSKNVFNFYVEDPSNNDEKYQRIKIRKLIKELKKSGLSKEKFLNTIKNLKYSNSVVNFYVNENLQKNTSFLNNNKRLILNESFFQQPYEIIFRSMSDSIKLVGKKYYSTRGMKLSKILSDIENNRLFKVTLGGCIIEKVNQTVIISKEY
jgi:tRNA(Ile)-lysidine synthase